MRSPQNHAGRLAGLERFLPARRTQAPAVAGPQAGKAKLRRRRRKIIAVGFGKLEELSSHDGADGMTADVFSTRIAAAVSKEPVMGFIEQSSSRSPRTFLGACGRPRSFPVSSLSTADLWIAAAFPIPATAGRRQWAPALVLGVEDSSSSRGRPHQQPPALAGEISARLARVELANRMTLCGECKTLQLGTWLLELVLADRARVHEKAACCDACYRRVLRRRRQLGIVQSVLASGGS
jgi:hypothetical protein